MEQEVRLVPANQCSLQRLIARARARGAIALQTLSVIRYGVTTGPVREQPQIGLFPPDGWLSISGRLVAIDSLTSHNDVMATFSTYEAKARFSEVLRLVSSGTPVTVTRRGEPVAEIRPIEKTPQTIGERLAELERRGILVRQRARRKPLVTVARRAGALKRFLAERNG